MLFQAFTKDLTKISYHGLFVIFSAAFAFSASADTALQSDTINDWLPVVSEHVDSITTLIRGNSATDISDRPFSPEFNLRTDLLKDAVGTMSIGTEVKISRRASVELGLLWNPWTFTDHTMYKQWRVSPELRWWPRQKGEWTDAEGRRHSALSGHFFGVHLLGGEFNYSRVRLPFNAFPDLKGHRFEGWFLGGGVSYGYRYNVSRRFALETEIGFGIVHVDFEKYNCGKCGERVGRGHRTYVGPTRAALNLVLRIGDNPRMSASRRSVRDLERTVITRTIERQRVDTVYLGVQPQTTSDLRNLRSASYELRLQYPLSSSEIIENLGSNRHQIAGLKDFIDSYAENPDVRIASIDIEGWASLEGNAEENLRLSEDRATSAALLIGELFPDLARLVHAQGMGEDWQSPEFEGKDRLMTIGDLDERERRLRAQDGGRVFERLLRSQLPQNRRIECTIKYAELK